MQQLNAITFWNTSWQRCAPRPRGNRSKETVEQYAHDLARLFDWVTARQQESEAARPPEVTAPTSVRMPLEKARQRLATMIRDAIANLVSLG